jgi:hypothetical protein
MFIILLTFAFTTILYAFLLWLAARRVVRHLQEAPEGVKALTEHLLVPLLGRKPTEEPQSAPTTAVVKPGPKPTKGALV